MSKSDGSNDKKASKTIARKHQSTLAVDGKRERDSMRSKLWENKKERVIEVTESDSLRLGTS